MFSLNDRGSGDQPWYALCLTLVERAMLTWERAPAVFVVLALAFYSPARIFTTFAPSVQPWVAAGISAFLYTGAFVFTAAGATAAVSRLREGANPSVAGAFGQVFGAKGALLGTVILGGALELVGALAFIVPALVVGFWLVFSGPAVLYENVWGWSAVQRGRELVGHNRWIQVGSVLVTAVLLRIVVVMAPLFVIKTYMILSHGLGMLADAVLTVWTATVDVTILSVVAAWVGLAYFDVKDAG